MGEIRQNIATREWVIIATERAKRPEDFAEPDKEKIESRPERDDKCPFCPGNEELDLERLRVPESGPWQLRVVRNKYPALHEQGELTRNFKDGNRSISGVGYHEVVVQTPRHNSCPALLPAEEFELTLKTFQQRGLALKQDERIEQIVYFENHGAQAGASLAHPHSQIVALPVVPYTIRSRNEEAQRYFDDHGECVFCKLRHDEEQAGARVVLDSKHYTAFVPYAAYSPFHMWIIPRSHHPHFSTLSDEQIADLAQVLRAILRKLYVGLNDPDYNYVIRTAPKSEQNSEYLHWYVAIIPRLSHTAGFEMGTGMFINTALPEQSAQFLRDVRI